MTAVEDTREKVGGSGASALGVPEGGVLLLYDGVCALCNGTVNFLLARDERDQFRFAALQSDLGRDIVERHGRNPDDLDTVCAVLGAGTPDERMLIRSRAVLTCVRRLGGIWSLAGALRIIPAFILDLGYRLVARIRYQVFGKKDACPIPEPEHRHKFLA